MKETSRKLIKGGLMKEVMMKKREIMWSDAVLWDAYTARVEDMKVFCVFCYFIMSTDLKEQTV